MIHDMSYEIVSSHQADLRREADRSRLASLAACCSPSVMSGLISRLRRTQDCDA